MSVEMYMIYMSVWIPLWMFIFVFLPLKAFLMHKDAPIRVLNMIKLRWRNK